MQQSVQYLKTRAELSKQSRLTPYSSHMVLIILADWSSTPYIYIYSTLHIWLRLSKHQHLAGSIPSYLKLSFELVNFYPTSGFQSGCWRCPMPMRQFMTQAMTQKHTMLVFPLE